MNEPKSKLSRRTLFAGAGTAGALAAAAAVMPRIAVPDETITPEAKAPPERGGGYQLTEHVRRYYKTATL